MRRRILQRFTLLAITAILLGLSGCSGRSPDFHLTNVTGHMPDLKLFGAKNARGQVRTAADYRGKVVILYFGYTHCPDVCPLTLSKLHQVMRKLGSTAKQVQVLFVTVDPKRDTPAVLRQYLAAFDSRFEALRPTGEALDSFTHHYDASYSYDQPDANGNYVVNHSAAIYIFDGKGKMRLIGTGGADTTSGIAADIRKLASAGSSWWPF